MSCLLLFNHDALFVIKETQRLLNDCRFHAKQKANPDHRFTLPEDFTVVFSDAGGEMVVGGVFLRLFIANPGWVLRKPKEFLTELLEKWCSMTAVSSPNVCLYSMLSSNGKDVPLTHHTLKSDKSG